MSESSNPLTKHTHKKMGYSPSDENTLYNVCAGTDMRN